MSIIGDWLIGYIWFIFLFFFLKCVIKLVNYVNNCCIFGNEFIIKFNFFVFCWSWKIDIFELRFEKFVFFKVRGIIFIFW